MALSTSAKQLLNRALAPLNLRLDTLTARRTEQDRLARLAEAGHFETPPYPLAALADFEPGPFVAAWNRWGERLARLASEGDAETGYDPANIYFPPPDAEALYLVAQIHRPRRWIEIGSGNSTRVARRAILDGGLDTRLTAIDPEPRVEIAAFADEVHRTRLEDYRGDAIGKLAAGDVLFIDSSHAVAPGNDVARLFLDLVPALPPGVIVHVHDIFLPYEYPREWIAAGQGWNEQYLLHALLSAGRHRILWPGHHLQRDRPEMVAKLPFLSRGRAQSFWFATG